MPREDSPENARALRATRASLSNVIRAKQSASGALWRRLHRVESNLVHALGRVAPDNRKRKAKRTRKHRKNVEPGAPKA